MMIKTSSSIFRMKIESHYNASKNNKLNYDSKRSITKDDNW